MEFEGYSKWDEPHVRVDKTNEGVKLMIKLWTQKKVSFNGQYYETKGAVLDPTPVQKPYPQLLFGGQGDRMLRLAGRYADICYISPFRSRTSLEDYLEGKRMVLRAAEQVHRQHQIAFMAGDLSAWEPYDAETYSQQIEEATEKGASYFLTSFSRGKEIVDSMRRFAEEVMPSFK